MLIACPSCRKRISDRVPACPFCGSFVRSDAPPPASTGTWEPPTRPRPQRGRSPLVYALAGCGALTMLAVLAVGAGAYFWKRKIAESKRENDAMMEEQRTNPALRAAKASEILHAEQLPDGYYASFFISMPKAEGVMLVDHPPGPAGELSGFAERAFVYTRTWFHGVPDSGIRAFVVGDKDDPSGVRVGPFGIGTNAIIRRGMLNLVGGTILYCAQRGELSDDSNHRLGLQVVTLIDCPEDSNLRTALWFGPDPSPGTPVAQLDLTGTVADEKELRIFLSNFRVCGPRS